MYAVVKTGGKQYRVTPGDVILVEKLLGETGGKLKLENVLMIGEDGKATEIGAPLVAKAAVNCEILDQSRAEKVIVFKKKKRKGYRRLNGHRQEQTVLRVLDINGKGAVKPKAAAKRSCFAVGIKYRSRRSNEAPVGFGSQPDYCQLLGQQLDGRLAYLQRLQRYPATEGVKDIDKHRCPGFFGTSPPQLQI